MRLYTIKDRVAEEFSMPFAAKGDGVAMRKAKEMFSRVPRETLADFSLWHVGSFNENDGVITPCIPEMLNIILPEKNDTEVK